MSFDRNVKRGAIGILIFNVVVGLAALVGTVAIVIVAVHFIVKWW